MAPGSTFARRKSERRASSRCSGVICVKANDVQLSGKRSRETIKQPFMKQLSLGIYPTELHVQLFQLRVKLNIVPISRFFSLLPSGSNPVYSVASRSCPGTEGSHHGRKRAWKEPSRLIPNMFTQFPRLCALDSLCRQRDICRKRQLKRPRNIFA